MNFLAHLYLSPDNEDILLGNFIADAVKGKTFDNYKQSIKNGILIKNTLILPKKSKRILPFMITQNWLVNYANFKGLQRVSNGMSRRTTFNSGIENAVNDLKNDYKLYEKEFSEFFPEIIEYVKDYNNILSTFEV